MTISCELPQIAQKEIKSGFLYVWITNGNDPKVVRLSGDGEYILESWAFEAERLAFETECWEFVIEMAGKFYGPLTISGADADELIDDLGD